MSDGRSNGALTAIAALLAVWVAVLFVRTPVPSEDGVSYLWIAQQFAAGNLADALSTVFPPGFPLLLAPWLWCGVDAERAACAVSTACLVLSLWPLARCAERLAPGAALPAAVLFASSPLLGRLAAEVYSEPAFLLVMLLGTWAGLSRRWAALGVAAGVAFWIRPEGLLLVPAFAFGHTSLRAAAAALLRASLPALLFVASLALLRWSAGHGFDALPIHGFHELRDDLPLRGAFFTNLLAVPGPWLEALGLAGILCWLPRKGPSGRPLLAAMLLQIAVVCTFVVRRRFFVSCGHAAILLAAAAVVRLPRRVALAALTIAVLHGLSANWNGGIDQDRSAERQLGQYLQSQMAAGRTVTGDLARVRWFAGLPPLPPRRFDDAQLAAMAQAHEVQFLVLGERDPAQRGPQLAAAIAGAFEPLPLPDALRAACAQRGIIVFVRR